MILDNLMDGGYLLVYEIHPNYLLWAGEKPVNKLYNVISINI